MLEEMFIYASCGTRHDTVNMNTQSKNIKKSVLKSVKSVTAQRYYNCFTYDKRLFAIQKRDVVKPYVKS